MGAHPRSRGENTGSRQTVPQGAGSSPLTRGKQHRVVAHQKVPGLIPAHAGKTPANAPPKTAPRAHPRSRGENFGERLGRTLTGGSSPLTRGKLEMIQERFPESGLIPAHAGKTGC